MRGHSRSRVAPGFCRRSRRCRVGLCQGLGVSHDVLVWTGWNGAGNLQDQARRARYGLLTDWAVRRGVSAIALGHTADDQAETLLMRLGRAAGVTGLAGMAARRDQGGIEVLRPMLSITRVRLRAYLSKGGKSWVEDPSNHDERFDRIRARHALDGLVPWGSRPSRCRGLPKIWRGRATHWIGMRKFPPATWPW